MKPANYILFALILWLIQPLSVCRAEALVDEIEPENKLLQMYQLYYLPFSVEFKQGRNKNDILPYLTDTFSASEQLLSADALRQLDADWSGVRDEWRKKSLLLNSPVALGGMVKVSNHIRSFRIPLTTSAFDNLPVGGRAAVREALAGKSAEVQADFTQQRFLKRFVTAGSEEQFTFVMFSASWCDSCKEYRMLIEHYLKTFPDAGVYFQSVVIDDPKEQLFESAILRELFPHPKKYSHDSIPRFLAVQETNGSSKVWEEGDALRELYDRVLRLHRGYLNNKSIVFRNNTLPETVKRSAMSR